MHFGGRLQSVILIYLRWFNPNTTSYTEVISKDNFYSFGIELNLKSTEYKVTDDSTVPFSIQDELFNKNILSAEEEYLDNLPIERNSVSENDFKFVAYELIEFVGKYSGDKLALLNTLLQSFLIYYKKIPACFSNDSNSNDSIDSSSFRNLFQSIQQNSNVLQTSATTLFQQGTAEKKTCQIFVNGIQIEDSDLFFNIFKIIKVEEQTVGLLKSLIDSEQDDLKYDVFELIGSVGTFKPVNEVTSSSSNLYDIRKFLTKSAGLVFWWNDLEKDKKYSQYPSDLSVVFRSMSIEHLYIRKNLFVALVISDLSDGILSLLERIRSGLSVRLGWIPLLSPNSNINVDNLRIIYGLIKKGTKKDLLDYFTTKSTNVDLSDAFTEDEFNKYLTSVKRFNSRFSITKPSLFINGQFYELKVSNYYDPILIGSSQLIQYLQKLVYLQVITQYDDFYSYLVTSQGRAGGVNDYRSKFLTFKRYNQYSLPHVNATGFDVSGVHIEEKYYIGKSVFFIIFVDNVKDSEFVCEFLSLNSDKDERGYVVVSPLENFQCENSTLTQDLNIIKPSSSATIKYPSVWVNGRTISGFEKGSTFTEFEYSKLHQIEMKSLSIFKLKRSFRNYIPVVTCINYLNDYHSSSEKRKLFNIDKLDYQSIIQTGHSNDLVTITAKIDPLDASSQKLVAILQYLSKNYTVNCVLIPRVVDSLEQYNKLLINQRLYRYALGENDMISFKNIPPVLFSMGFDVAQPWFLIPRISEFDLDNIKVSDGDLIDVELELRNILVEGHCYDLAEGKSPRGLEVELVDLSSGNVVSDTLVMANLGYFQLRANVGTYILRIREGRSKLFYRITYVETEGKSGTTVRMLEDGSVELICDGFEGVTLWTFVEKNPGYEGKDLLEDEGKDHENSIQKVFNWFTGNDVKKTSADINIFAVASGHLYERLLRIMIKSVLSKTKHSVKFWFIENFMSPSFRNFLPKYAEINKFQYELVTYKWPKWLRAQQEKQRTIWGYKILFLDVLFPLGLDKVIFVDADQIVRADLYELVQMNLNGAPYGYAPFCDSRKEIEGFRFWKTGYWKEHLRNKPYHISALYVVDLRRLRQLAAGDRLRQHYQMVSEDPNSLANLDQDLPNDMQSYVPIHSLPQEWLWCETWCDDESLKKAKTIDLCNNPMTKEPKLERAKRLLPEWTVFDEEQRKEFEEWRQEGKKSSSRDEL